MRPWGKGLDFDMSRWSEQFESNAIHQTLKQMSDWLNVEVKDIDADHEAERRRLAKSISAIMPDPPHPARPPQLVRLLRRLLAH